tara:strand:- start:1662 stop:1826 length:165 start_codon:yes stop_codon:yes gene_type:complete
MVFLNFITYLSFNPNIWRFTRGNRKLPKLNEYGKNILFFVYFKNEKNQRFLFLT